MKFRKTSDPKSRSACHFSSLFSLIFQFSDWNILVNPICDLQQFSRKPFWWHPYHISKLLHHSLFRENKVAASSKPAHLKLSHLYCPRSTWFTKCFAITLMKSFYPKLMAFDSCLCFTIMCSNTVCTVALWILISIFFNWSWNETIPIRWIHHLPSRSYFLYSIAASRVPATDMKAAKYLKWLTCSTATSSTLILIVFASVFEAIELLVSRRRRFFLLLLIFWSSYITGIRNQNSWIEKFLEFWYYQKIQKSAPNCVRTCPEISCPKISCSTKFIFEKCANN